MHPEPTTAAEVWASVRRLKPRPKAPVVLRKPLVIAKPIAIPVEIPAPKVVVRETLTLMLLRKTVMSVANVSFQEFTSLRRHHSIMKSRFAFYWLAHRYTGASYPQIGRFVGDRDHSTVMSSFASKTMQLPEVQGVIAEVERRLNLKKPDTNRISPVANFLKGGGGPLTDETIDAEPRESSQEGSISPSNQSIPRKFQINNR